MTEFAGYEMPLWYTTTTDEHLAVRNHSGIFDVSHMGRFLVEGDAAGKFLEGLVPTNVELQSQGKAFYTLLLNDGGGIIDDLIIEKLAEARYMVVVNAANAETDKNHMLAHALHGAAVKDLTPTTVMIAVQGPKSTASLQPLTDLNLGQLKRFRCAETEVAGASALVSRTGYTGEDGFEVIIYDASSERPEKGMTVWEKLATTSTPCGLGARDSLRLEAGLPLHGLDMDSNTDPFQADLSWVISAGKPDYIGSEAVTEAGTRPPSVIRRGLVLDSGIPRHGFDVLEGSTIVGKITSGTFSPILHKGVAQCQVERGHSNFGAKVTVDVRGADQPGTVTKPPFYDDRVYGWKRQNN